MPRLTKWDWEQWNKERQRFLNQETQGFEADLATLEKHIKTLLDVAPKDKAGWPIRNCLEIIDKLQRDLNKAKTFQGQMP